MSVRQLSCLLVVFGVAACGPKAPSDAASGTPGVQGQDTANSAQPLPIVANQPPTTNVPPQMPPRVVPQPPPSRPAPTPIPVREEPARPAPRSRGLEIGTTVATTMIDSVHSRYNRIGDTVKVRVTDDVRDRDGRTIIPAGSIVNLQIGEIGMADSRGEKGTLVLIAKSVEIHGTSRPFNASATDYDYEMRSRGITGGDIAKAGAGVVAGAILGRVVGGKSGTAVGAIGGGMAGAAVASATANRDIIVHAGTSMTLTMGDRFGG